MTTVVPAVAVAAADQKNVDPLVNSIATVGSTARGVRAVYIDGLDKETGKRESWPAEQRRGED